MDKALARDLAARAELLRQLRSRAGAQGRSGGNPTKAPHQHLYGLSIVRVVHGARDVRALKLEKDRNEATTQKRGPSTGLGAGVQREVSLPGLQLDAGNIAHLAPSLLPVLQTT
jgi:hypothetical protein